MFDDIVFRDATFIFKANETAEPKEIENPKSEPRKKEIYWIHAESDSLHIHTKQGGTIVLGRINENNEFEISAFFAEAIKAKIIPKTEAEKPVKAEDIKSDIKQIFWDCYLCGKEIFYCESENRYYHVNRGIMDFRRCDDTFNNVAMPKPGSEHTKSDIGKPEPKQKWTFIDVSRDDVCFDCAK